MTEPGRSFRVLDRIEVPDTWDEITSGVPRSPGAPAAAAAGRRIASGLVALVVAVGGIGLVIAAFHTRSGPPISPPPPSTPKPTVSKGNAVHLPGIGFAVCDVSQITGDMNGDGEPDALYVFSRAATNGTCPPSKVEIAYVGIRRGHTGPIVTDTNASVKCRPRCQGLATPTIGGVRTFAVRVSASSFALFRLPANGGAMVPLTVTLPKTGPQGVGYFLLDVLAPNSVSGFECLPDGRAESWGAALAHEGNGPYLVTQTTYALRGSALVQLSRVRSTVPQNDVAGLPQSGGIGFGAPHVLCDSPLVASP